MLQDLQMKTARKFYRFRNCYLNCEERRVLKDGEYLELTPKTFDVLQLLVEKRGEIVTKDEILGKVWNGSLIEEGNLAVHVSKLRRLLGETKTERFIETVPGIGYRFVAPISKSKPLEPTGNRESRKYYLKGKYFFEKRTAEEIHKAVDCFRKSISLDPTNPLPYFETVECYRLLYSFDYISYKEFSAHVRPIVASVAKLEQYTDVVHIVYASVTLALDWKFEEAEQHLKTALEINPDSLIAHTRYSELLLLLGRFSEACEELEQISRIDHVSVVTYNRLGRLFYGMRQPEKAFFCLNEALELEPSHYETLTLLGGVLTELGDYPAAIATFNKVLEIQNNSEILGMIGYISALDGERDKAIEVVEQLESQSKVASENAIKRARIYLALGEKETVYELLDEAFHWHESDLMALKADPRWASVREEPRFIDLVKRVGLPVS